MSVKKLVQCFAVVACLAVSVDSANAQNAHVRDGFWISGGLGFGSLGCENCGSQRESSISGDLSLGGTISPRFMLGAGSAAWTKSEDGATLTVGTLDARVRFYPSRTGGFFVTGGLGFGSVRGSVGGISATETGVGTILGLGWDIRVAKNTSITPYWNGFAMKNDNTDANVGQAGIAVTLH
jgi:hypothetical protein